MCSCIQIHVLGSKSDRHWTYHNLTKWPFRVVQGHLFQDEWKWPLFCWTPLLQSTSQSACTHLFIIIRNWNPWATFLLSVVWVCLHSNLHARLHKQVQYSRVVHRNCSGYWYQSKVHVRLPIGFQPWFLIALIWTYDHFRTKNHNFSRPLSLNVCAQSESFWIYVHQWRFCCPNLCRYDTISAYDRRNRKLRKQDKLFCQTWCLSNPFKVDCTKFHCAM